MALFPTPGLPESMQTRPVCMHILIAFTASSVLIRNPVDTCIAGSPLLLIDKKIAYPPALGDRPELALTISAIYSRISLFLRF
jgi:hypothetical protein